MANLLQTKVGLNPHEAAKEAGGSVREIRDMFVPF